MSAFLMAFGSSVAWGTADFLGGLKARQLPLLNVLIASQGTGFLLVLTFVAIRGEAAPGGDFAIFAALSGVAGAVGLAAFYRGLAVGNMGVVAPISATSAVIPVVVGVATGDRPSFVQGIGLALALVGVVLASREEVEGGRAQASAEPRRRRMAPGAGLALLSAAGFGCFFLLMDKASDGDVAWAMLVNRVAGVSLLLAAALALRPPLRAGRNDLPVLLLIGTLDVGANALFGVAATMGLVSLVSVLGSLYPITTVALARIVLGERAHALAQVGVVTALLGVALIAGG